MRSRHIMVALPAGGRIGPIETSKVASLARALDADVELFHCLYDVEVARPVSFARRSAQQGIHELADRRRQELEALAERMRAAGVRVRTSVRWDYPAYAGIVRQVLRHKPSLLIAHPTQRGAAARHLLGRTDFRLIESCPCPVLLLKTRRPYTDSVILAAVDPSHAHDKPAALDAEILRWADRLRDGLAAKLLLFHTHAPLEQATDLQRELRRTPEAVRADVTAAWRNSLEAGARSLAEEYAVSSRRVYLAEGPASEALVRLAREVMPDIVVMGAASRSRLGALLIGHTAEQVVDALDCDVLIVKPPGFRSSVSPQSTHHVKRGAAPAAHMVYR